VMEALAEMATLFELQCVHFHPVEKVLGARPEAGQLEAPEHTHGVLLKMFTLGVIGSYSRTSEDFQYRAEQAPVRVLTKPSEGVRNDGHTNAEHDYICRVRETVCDSKADTYEFVERLGYGAFGQVMKCQHNRKGGSSSVVALKLLRSKSSYLRQGKLEAEILDLLRRQDPDDQCHVVRMLDSFVHRGHLCIAFEMLTSTLHEVLQERKFEGLDLRLVALFTKQLLKALIFLRQTRVIHSDIKPENIMLRKNSSIKLIDFGSACFEDLTVYKVVTSRFYRSPEVLLAVPYTTAIDMWSLGCVCGELFQGLPVFAGQTEFDQVFRICEILRVPPAALLEAGSDSRKYFNQFFEVVRGDIDTAKSMVASGDVQILPAVCDVDGDADDEGDIPSSDSTAAETDDHTKSGRADKQSGYQEKAKPTRIGMRRINRWSLKTLKEYEQGEFKKQPVKKRYSHFESIQDIISNRPFAGKLSDKEKECESDRRMKFEQMLTGMLCMNPDNRWTPKQVHAHTFITGERHDSAWELPPDTKVTRFAEALPPKQVRSERKAARRCPT